MNSHLKNVISNVNVSTVESLQKCFCCQTQPLVYYLSHEVGNNPLLEQPGDSCLPKMKVEEMSPQALGGGANCSADRMKVV